MLLSVVWLTGPDFPENLIWAQTLMVFFGVLLLLATYNFARSLQCSRAGAIAITAIFSIHPSTITLSTILLTEVVFAGLLLSSMVCADRYLQGTAKDLARPQLMVRLLLSVVAMILPRTLGVPAALGIAACGAYRRNFRFSLAVVGAALLAEGAWLSWTIAHRSDWVLAAGSSDIVRTTSAYYSSYTQFWFASVPDWQTLVAIVKTNAQIAFWHPAVMCLQLPLHVNPLLFSAVGAATSALAYVGMFRDARRAPRVVHFVMPLYGLIVLTWNFPIVPRLLFPFVPYVLWGFGREATRFAGVLREAWVDSSKPIQRSIVCAWAVIAVGVGVQIAYQYLLADPNGAEIARETRMALSAEKAEAYTWVKRNTTIDDRFIAYDDALLFLHTGRQAIMPAVAPTTGLYRDDSGLPRHALGNFDAVARAIDARYWVVSTDDQRIGGSVAIGQSVKILAVAPVVFTSSSGNVRIHDLSGW